MEKRGEERLGWGGVRTETYETSPVRCTALVPRTAMELLEFVSRHVTSRVSACTCVCTALACVHLSISGSILHQHTFGRASTQAVSMVNAAETYSITCSKEPIKRIDGICTTLSLNLLLRLHSSWVDQQPRPAAPSAFTSRRVTRARGLFASLAHLLPQEAERGRRAALDDLAERGLEVVGRQAQHRQLALGRQQETELGGEDRQLVVRELQLGEV